MIISRDFELTNELILKLTNDFEGGALPRLAKLERYYAGNHPILGRDLVDKSKPNNRQANVFGADIVDNFAGYFMGKPVKYQNPDEKAEKDVQMIFAYNDEADTNMTLTKLCGVFGKAYEILYVDKEGMVRFKAISPKEMFAVYDDTLEQEMLYAFRYYKSVNPLNNQEEGYIEVYDSSFTRRYKTDALLSTLSLLEETPHYFGMVPVVEYQNNDESTADFEKVIGLIDVYDKVLADGINDIEAFADAIMKITGDFDLGSLLELAPDMRQNRMIAIPAAAQGQVDVDWLMKDSSKLNVEPLLDLLERNIYRFSKCANLSDEKFAGNLSGVAMEFKTLGMENVAGIKERKFKKGLQRRLELISAIGALTFGTFDWRAFSFLFTRNLPVNELENANIANLLRGIVSAESIIEILPYELNVEEEMKRLREERGLYGYEETMATTVDLFEEKANETNTIE